MAVEQEQNLSDSQLLILAKDQIADCINYSRIMLNLFRLRKEDEEVTERLLEIIQRLDDQGLMVMRVGLGLLRRTPEVSDFFLTESYELAANHELGFKVVIDGDIAQSNKAQYFSGIVVKVYFLGQFRSLALVDFDLPVESCEQEKDKIKAMIVEEFHTDEVIFDKFL